jgi:hypothetical protein
VFTDRRQAAAMSDVGRTQASEMEGQRMTRRPRVRVGVIGCGEVTQIIHLPTLSILAGEFEWRPTSAATWSSSRR